MKIPAYLVNEHYDDRYFDVVDAIEEAKHIFFRGTGITETLSGAGPGRKEFHIGETGFGAGRLLVALMGFLDSCGIPDIHVTYNSVELHPVTSERMESILSGFRAEAGSLVDLLVQAYSRMEISGPGWQRTRLLRSFGSVTLNLWIGEALEMVRALTIPCDVWFLDGHGPKKNPDMWRPELLMAIGEKTVTGGACATFTVAGAVRRGLTVAGFSIEQRPGFGGKKSVLAGRKL
ncbi:MAG TPA: tRNA (5-methylaminomethyl-2-thiouridine)(34)-methyltransferase MnmD [Thermodesulfovibrionales bacterium]|nr:tRNA (5-methylaminomethyl-2-thiouridine)(34)-methyltransferase MnmD [Thermodesulfovibrionales bacterium]